MGILSSLPTTDTKLVVVLRDHTAQERAAIAGDDVVLRTFLLGDFHVCMAEAIGNHTLADIQRDLSERTMLIFTLYQSTHDAAASCEQHEGITQALAEGDRERAAKLMTAHLGNVEAGLSKANEPRPAARSATRPRPSFARNPRLRQHRSRSVSRHQDSTSRLFPQPETTT